MSRAKWYDHAATWICHWLVRMADCACMSMIPYRARGWRCVGAPRTTNGVIASERARDEAVGWPWSDPNTSLGVREPQRPSHFPSSIAPSRLFWIARHDVRAARQHHRDSTTITPLAPSLVQALVMSRPAVADFVDSFFTRLLFQPDDSIATASLDELSPNAEIK